MVKLPQTLQPMMAGGGDASNEGSVSAVRIQAIAAGRDHTLLLGKKRVMIHLVISLFRLFITDEMFVIFTKEVPT